MLKEYVKYLIGIRNSLIQGGAEIPLTPIKTYRDTFREGLRLDDAVWFYSVLAIGGSEYALSGSPLPLGGYYKERMRQVFYEEYLEDREAYKKLISTYYQGKPQSTVVELEDLYEDLNSYPIEELEEPILEEPSDENINSYPIEESVLEELSVLEVVHGTFIEDIEGEVGGSRVKEFESEESDEIVHGTFIEDISLEVQGVVSEYDSSGIVHGTFIADIAGSKPKGYVSEDDFRVSQNEEIVHGTFIEDIEVTFKSVESSSGGVVHGTFIEDIELSLPNKNPQGGTDVVHGVFIEDIEIVEKQVINEEEIHGIYIEDIEIVEKESVSSIEEEDIHGIFIEDIEIPDEDDSFDEPDIEEEIVKDSPTSTKSHERVDTASASVETVVEPQELVQEPGPEPDLADALTDITNRLLTKGKRLFYKELKKMK